jgi:hypothetical protein
MAEIFRLFGSMRANALRQLTALKPAHPAPMGMFTENCCRLKICLDSGISLLNNWIGSVSGEEG